MRRFIQHDKLRAATRRTIGAITEKRPMQTADQSNRNFVQSDVTISSVRFPTRLLAATMILMVIVAGWLLWESYTSYTLTVAIREQYLRAVELRGTILQLDEVLTMSARMAVATGNPEWETRYNDNLPILNDAISQAFALSSQWGGIGDTNEQGTSNATLMETEVRALALVRDGRPAEARAILFSQEYETQKQRYSESLNKFLAQLNDRLNTTLNAEQGRVILSTIFAVVALIMAIVCGLVFSRSLFRWRTTLLTEIAERKQIAHLLEAQMLSEQAIRSEAQRLQLAESESRSRLEDAVAEYLSFTKTVSQGDLSKRLVSTYDGALGQLGEGLNGMVTNLHTMTAQVQEATNAITAAAVQILASTVQQAAAATEQSTTITEATTSVEEVKTVAQQTANQASKVAEDSQTAQQIAQQGAQVVRETLEGMAQIRQQVDTIAPTIEALASHSQEVGVVIATLSELADEINKLASNAAIASTRQSEVDQEDLMSMSRLARRLADQTQTTTEEVRRLLSEIQQGTRLSVEVTKTGINKVEASSRLMEQAGEAMQYMASEIEQGAQVNIQIAAAARQQMIGMEQIGQAMVGIQQATTQALAGTRETEHAAQSLNNLAQSLQEAVTAYQL